MALIPQRIPIHRKRRSTERARMRWQPCAVLLAAASFLFAPPSPTQPGQGDSPGPVVVQPGAPGQPTKVLPPSSKAKLPPLAPADVEFMQGMIMHHGQAIEMTALIPSHTENKELRSLGARISRSQDDEIRFMRRWLAARGQSLSLPMPDNMLAGMSHADSPQRAMASMPLMPGMLTAEQMEALGKATGAEFDRLFLMGMIQHHNGALTMVKDLFGAAGAGQDAEIFGFATDVDTGQRAEIRIMQAMLETGFEKKGLGEKR